MWCILLCLPVRFRYAVSESLKLDARTHDSHISDHIRLVGIVGIPKVSKQPVAGRQMPQTETCPCLSEGSLGISSLTMQDASNRRRPVGSIAPL